MKIDLLPASNQDFDYCERLYFSGMENIIEELKLDIIHQAATFRRQWDVAQIRIITLDDANVGWLQSIVHDDALFLAQLFVEGPFQKRGIGSAVMHRLIGEASGAQLAMALGVVKSNPAVSLYRRLGFRTVHEDDMKFYMRREPEQDDLIAD